MFMPVLIVYQLVSYFGKWKILHQSHWIGWIGQSILALGFMFDTPGIEVNWDSELTRFLHMDLNGSVKAIQKTAQL